MDAEASLMYKMLPQLIQRRVPKLASLQRPLSWSGSSSASSISMRPSTPPPPAQRPSTSDSDASETPPPSYRSSRRNSRLDLVSTAASAGAAREGSGSLWFGGAEAAESAGDGTGINWKYADQGMRLLDQSLQESPQFGAPLSKDSPPFSRHLYIHALTYLLRASPSDLNEEEIVAVRNAVPVDVREDIARQCSTSSDPSSAQGWPPSDTATATAMDRSALHRLVAFLTLHLFLFANLLAPYARALAGAAYRYERRYRLSERAFSAGVGGADRMASGGLELSRALYRVNDGKLGQAINEVMVYWVRGVVGGVHEGVGEGLSVVGSGTEQVQGPGLGTRRGRATLEAS